MHSSTLIAYKRPVYGWCGFCCLSFIFGNVDFLIRRDFVYNEENRYYGGESDDEIKLFEQLLQSNAHLIYKYAANGGIQIA